MNLRTFGIFKSANHKKDCVRKPQFHKMPNLRKVRKSKICGFAICGTYLRIAHRWLYTDSLVNFLQHLSFSDVYIFVLCPEKRRRTLQKFKYEVSRWGKKAKLSIKCLTPSLLVIFSLKHLSFSAYFPLIRFLFCIYGSGVH
jgi:hypothetical protein